MVAQKCEKTLLAEIFCIFECPLPQNVSNQISLNPLDSSRPYGKLLENHI